MACSHDAALEIEVLKGTLVYAGVLLDTLLRTRSVFEVRLRGVEVHEG